MATIFGASGPTISSPALLKSICGSNTVTRSAIILTYYKGRGSRETELYLDANVPVFLNLNWKVPGGEPNQKVPVPFPTDMAEYRRKLIPVFEYYKNHPKKDMLVMVCENEENTKAYHSGPMSDYLRMLETFVATAKPYGYKTTNGGVPVDSVNSSAANKAGKSGEVWELLQGFANIDMWKVNLHTHNKNPKDSFDSGKIGTAVRKVRDITDKDSCCNEFHIEPTNNTKIIADLCKGWDDAEVELVVFLSGTSNDVVLNQGTILTLFGRGYKEYIEKSDSFRERTLVEEDDLDVDEDDPVEEANDED
jgi:hypothetical protein